MKAIVLVAAGVLAPTCLAQYEPFPDVPENHWVYETILKLHREELVTSSLGLLFRGGRPADKMELATWTAHACSAMLQRLESAEADTTKFTARSQAVTLHLLAKETDNLARMIVLFEPELKIRHIDTIALRRDMRSFPRRIERVAGVNLGDDPDARNVPPSDFANTPKNRWVYAALDSMLNHGILSGYRFPFPGQLRDDRHTKANESREVIASAMIRTYEKVVAIYRNLHESLEDDYVKLKEAGNDLGRIRSTINRLSKSLEILPGFDDSVSDLIRMTYLFSDDIKKLNTDPEKMIRDLKDLLHGSPNRIRQLIAMTPEAAQSEHVTPAQKDIPFEQYPDIPENHWVYQTLLNLRNSNIIDLPDSFFRGSRPLNSVQVAHAAFDACVEFRHRLAYLLSPGGSGGDATYKQMKLLYEDIANLAKMADEFADEFKWMLINPVALKKEMESLAKFVDEGRRRGGGYPRPRNATTLLK